MQTSPVKPSQEPERVVRIPEARPPRNVPPAVTGIVAAALVALVLGTILGYAWGHRGIRDRDAEVAAAVPAARRAQTSAAQSAARADDLAARNTALVNQLLRARQGAALVRASRQELRAALAAAQRTIAATQAQVGEARQHAMRLAGQPLPPGRYVGRILAVGVGQSPPRLVFDAGTWFNGRSAQIAAIKDGVIGPNDPWPHKHYFRNEAVRWRTIRLSRGARVTLWNLGGHPGKHVVGIEQLQLAFSSRARWAEQIRHDPFWITVHRGRVVVVTQQRYP
jgi:hypothetical protein